MDPMSSQLVIVTYETRSRDKAQRLQKEAAKARRRYAPPPRKVYQHLVCSAMPPPVSDALKSLAHYPALRIGDTVECHFSPKTPGGHICNGIQLPSRGQAALIFEARRHAGPDGVEVVRQLEFEVFYYSFDDGLVCLRCQHIPAACGCGYASDLLEVNRDWKLKRDPSRRLGFRLSDDGSVTLALRIPRNRRPLTATELAAGCEPRSNAWNSKLKLKTPKDPKAVVLRLTEYSQAVLPSGGGQLGPRTVLSRSQAFARLVAKNGATLHTKPRIRRKDGGVPSAKK